MDTRYTYSSRQRYLGPHARRAERPPLTGQQQAEFVFVQLLLALRDRREPKGRHGKPPTLTCRIFRHSKNEKSSLCLVNSERHTFR